MNLGGGAEFNSAPPPAKFNSATPAEFDSAPGQSRQEGVGAENLIIPRERGRNI